MQALFAEQGAATIRLNEEVRGRIVTRVSRDVQAGEAVLLSDLDGFQAFELPDEELDYGYFTGFWTGSGWHCAFNFLRGRNRAAQTVDRAEQFLKVGRNASEGGYEAAAIDTLFTACELLAKAHLILHMLTVPSDKPHSYTKSKINWWRKLGNVDPAFVSLLNQLWELRQAARYEIGSPVPLTLPEGAVATIEREMVDLRTLWKRLAV